MDSLPTLREHYEQYRGARVYNAPLVDAEGRLLGNHGDHLMVLGGGRIHRDLEFEMVDDPAKAELLVIGGNGGMFGWSTGIPLILRNLCHEFPDTPLCMEPATFYFPEESPARLLGDRTAPVTLFCRERYSYDNLTVQHRLPDFCTVGLDHDTAFELRDSELAESLRGRDGRHVLIVERTDMEHPDAKFEISPVRKRASRWCPPAVKRALYPLVTAYRARKLSPYRRQCEAIVKRDHPEALRQPRVVCDVSNVNTGSFDDFCRSIAEASVVLTTRLHVGIFASILGRPTYLFEGPYHKIRGIYEYSLAEQPHVHFVPGDGDWTVPERAVRLNAADAA